MPLFTCNGDLHWFAHIPKCAGQSVEAYLERRFGSLAFVNNDFGRLRPEERWSKSSPQHIDGQAMRLLFPTDWIASSFAIVRHPIARLVSAFNYISVTQQGLPMGVTFEEWLDEYHGNRTWALHYRDQHLRTQTDMIFDDTQIFRLENGLDAVIDWLDKLEGRAEGPREIGQHNATDHTTVPDHFTRRTLPESVIARVAALYSTDFERFGYDRDADRSYEVFEDLRSDTSLPWYQRSRKWRDARRNFVRKTRRVMT